MSDINLEMYLDLQSIVDYNMFDSDMAKPKKINNAWIHILSATP
ncbi:hypothetical protein SAMN05421579_1763 [Xenorhabdus japonica]|uniref:Uncharacterized protein n=1 Tax=Xenorhabdus japonica TaxID=53341 RepID=A0A1I5EJ87_9GAMM|nr:hypothetical protein [Xenorhabdus japonica]SFO11574.1 hypothetical protein SAMN05421579_1763 [Xenorhabdus japonica]